VMWPFQFRQSRMKTIPRLGVRKPLPEFPRRVLPVAANSISPRINPVSRLWPLYWSARIDQGVSWFSIPATANYFGNFGTTTFTGDTATIVGNRYDVSGLWGSQMRFGFTAATGLTSCPVYALVG